MERSLSPHASVASNRRSALTNVWVHTQTDTGEIENLVNHFMLVTAGPCSDTLTVSLVLSFCLPLSLFHGLTHPSAASDVDRMCVMRDQDGVSAM